MEVGNDHRLPEKEIVNMFVSGLKSVIFREKIYSAFETPVDVIAETRHELANYRYIMEITERIKRPERKKDSKDRSTDVPLSWKQGSYSKAPSGGLS